MSKDIFLPDAETASRMIDNAWKDFKSQLEHQYGASVPDDSPLRDLLAAGYAYGWNDALNVIRDQMCMDEFINGFGKEKTDDEGSGNKGQGA